MNDGAGVSAQHQERLVLVRGGGDLATGVAWRLTRAGFPVVVTEMAQPLTVRRTVALSSAVAAGWVDIEGMVGERTETAAEALNVALTGSVAVVVSPELPPIEAAVVIDARMAKANLDTTINDAELVVGLGPGFTAGVDCHAVIETLRGPRLGRVLWSGSAAPNTGTPGLVSGHDVDRVLRSPQAGRVEWQVEIGAQVRPGQELGTVGGAPVAAPFEGVVRGLILDGADVPAGLKIGDLDARLDVNPHEISDKALAIGGGVLEAVLSPAS